jgi:hypothetical protein
MVARELDILVPAPLDMLLIVHLAVSNIDRKDDQARVTMQACKPIEDRQLLSTGCSGTRPEAEDHNAAAQLAKR